jgi:hypothetical protein
LARERLDRNSQEENEVERKKESHCADLFSLQVSQKLISKGIRRWRKTTTELLVLENATGRTAGPSRYNDGDDGE